MNNEEKAVRVTRDARLKGWWNVYHWNKRIDTTRDHEHAQHVAERKRRQLFLARIEREEKQRAQMRRWNTLYNEEAA